MYKNQTCLCQQQQAVEFGFNKVLPDEAVFFLYVCMNAAATEERRPSILVIKSKVKRRVKILVQTN